MKKPVSIVKQVIVDDAERILVKAKSLGMKVRRVTLVLHFALLLTVVISFVGKLAFEIGLYSRIEFALKLVVIGTGIILYFSRMKPVRPFVVYFCIYVVAAVLFALALIVKTMLGLVIILILIKPIDPGEIEYRNGDIIVYDNGGRFMSPCCRYRISERRLGIFEKELGSFETYSQIDFDAGVQFKHQSGRVLMSFRSEDCYDGTETDTVLVLRAYE